MTKFYTLTLTLFGLALTFFMSYLTPELLSYTMALFITTIAVPFASILMVFAMRNLTRSEKIYNIVFSLLILLSSYLLISDLHSRPLQHQEVSEKFEQVESTDRIILLNKNYKDLTFFKSDIKMDSLNKTIKLYKCYKIGIFKDTIAAGYEGKTDLMKTYIYPKFK